MTEQKEVSPVLVDGEIPEWVQQSIEEVRGFHRENPHLEAQGVRNPLLYLAERVKQQAKEIAELKAQVENLSKYKERLEKSLDEEHAIQWEYLNLVERSQNLNDKITKDKWELHEQNQTLSKDRERMDKLQSILDKHGCLKITIWNHDGRRFEDGVMYIPDFSERGGVKESLRDAIDATIPEDM